MPEPAVPTPDQRMPGRAPRKRVRPEPGQPSAGEPDDGGASEPLPDEELLVPRPGGI